MVILVSQNQTIPCKKALSLTTTNDNQKNMAIKVELIIIFTSILIIIF